MKDIDTMEREFYDLVCGETRNFNAQIEFLDKTFRKHNVKTVLDCGCGTGTHAALLAKKGYKVTAFDFNPHMVKAAKKKAKKAGVRIDFRQGDIKDFHFGRFDAAISLFSVLMFACKNQKELNQSIKCIKENLKPGGIGFFETCTPNLIKHSFELKKAEKGGTKLVRTRFYEKTHIKNLLETSYAFIIKRKGKPVQVIKARCTNRVFTKSETEQAIKRNGLRLLKTYGSLKNHGYENFSKKSIFISPLFIRSRTASL